MYYSEKIKTKIQTENLMAMKQPKMIFLKVFSSIMTYLLNNPAQRITILFISQIEREIVNMKNTYIGL